MRPRTITLLLVLSMLSLPLVAYGYQTAVLDQPVFAQADDTGDDAPATQVRKRLQIHDPENPIDDPLMTRQRIHAASATCAADDTCDQATHRRMQGQERSGAMSGTTVRTQSQQRLQIHDPENPIDDPLMTQQRLQQHAARPGAAGPGRGMLGGNTEAGTGTCTGECPND